MTEKIVIENISKAESLKNQLSGDIRSGGDRTGDGFPSARNLSRRFDASSHIVAQALSNPLELKNLESVQGGAARLWTPFSRYIEGNTK